jgi:molybdenum cofactor cytidylyltransferase
VFVTVLVLAAGSSHRLGRPKQTLPYRGTTLLDATLRVARSCGLNQVMVTLGGASEDVRAAVDLSDVKVVDNPDFGTGCGSSIAAAVDVLDERTDGIVLLLGDQPGVTPATVRKLIDEAGGAPLGVSRYTDALGHPFWLRRNVFADLRGLHGDKAVWKLLESGGYPVVEVDVAGLVPLDVDTWEDYEALLARDAQESQGVSS